MIILTIFILNFIDVVIMKFKKRNVPAPLIITSGWNGPNVQMNQNQIDAMSNPLDGVE